MGAHPEMVAGERRFCTALMRATSSRLITKAGAEGLQCVAIPSKGLGFARPGRTPVPARLAP